MNLPNRITIARILMIPVFLIVLLSGLLPAQTARYAAVGIFIVASASDFLDGYLARKMGLVTTFGKFMDPVADKLLVSAALVSMVELGDLKAWMAVVIISREFIVSGFRLVAAERGTVIAASMWAKIKTTVQMIMIAAVMVTAEGTVFESTVVLAVCELLKWLAVALTLISAYDYLYKNRDVFNAEVKNDG